MATTIKLKNSVTTTNTPSSLAQGEVAINITDKKVWVGNAATTPVQLLGDGGSATFSSITVTGVSTFSAGTVSAPSITTSGDTNTGIFFPAADTIAFTEGGVESMRITSDGNVGIGGTPANIGAGYQHLEVNGTTSGIISVSANGTRAFTCSADGSQVNIQSRVSGQPMLFYTNGGSVTERMRIDSSGNVGIGTSSPTALLHVNGTARASSMSLNGVSIGDYNLYSGMVARVSNGGGIGINSANATDNAYIYFGSGTSSGAQQSAAIGRIGGDVLALFTASAERMRIDSSGNVGIGTSSPNATYRLDVVGNAGIRIQGGTTGKIDLRSASGNAVFIGMTENGVADRGVIGFAAGSGDMQFRNNGAYDFSTGNERMRITSGGAVCIGRTSQIFGSTGLCVETSSNSVNCVVTNSGQSALSAVNTAVNTGTSCSLVSFNVGISGGGSQVGTITYNGTIVQYNSTSDQRLKKNIVDAGSGLAKLANVKIRAFDWKEHNSHTDFGVVAQELNEVAPEAVNAGDSGETVERIWAVDTSTLVPAMIKAIQELNAKVEAQAAEIALLKSK